MQPRSQSRCRPATAWSTTPRSSRPATRPLAEAVAAHREHREAPYAALVGGFVVSDTRPRRPGRAGRRRPAAGPRTSWSPAAPARSSRRSAGRAPTGSGSRGARDRAARRGDSATTSPATPAAWWRRSTQPAPTRCSTTTSRCTSSRRDVPLVADQAWLAALDEIAAAELRLKFRTGGVTADAFPSAAELAPCIDAALDREPPFKCTAGLHHAVRHTRPGDRASSTTASSTCCSRPGAASTAARRRRGRAVVDGPTATLLARLRRRTASGAALVHLVRLLQRDRTARATSSELGLLEDEHEPTWVEGAAGSLFDVDNLPYGVFSTTATSRRVGVRIGDLVARPGAGRGRRHARGRARLRGAVAQPAAGAWAGRPGPRLRAWLTELLTDEAERDLVEPHLVPVDEVTLQLPFEVADYVDFYCSLHHATNVGGSSAPTASRCTPNWRHLPVGYHGRAGTVVVSRHAGRPPARPAQAGRRGRTRLRPEPAPRHRGRGRLRRRRPSGDRRAGRRRRLRRARLRRRRCSTTGRPATSRPGSTCRSARSSASRSRPRSPAGSRRCDALDAARVDLPRPGARAAGLPGVDGRPASTSTSRCCSTARWSAGRRTRRCTGPPPRCSRT